MRNKQQPTNPKVQENIRTIFDLAMRINQETDYCVFVSISGHVSQMSVEIASSKSDYNNRKWSRSHYYDISEYQSLDEGTDILLRKQKIIIDELKDYLKEDVITVNGKKYRAID